MALPSLIPLRSGTRRIVVLLGAAGIALALFGMGYGFGRSHTDATAEPEPRFGTLPPTAEQPAAATAASLGDLLPGLEAKVAANPRDADLRVLLAQTYGELGQRDKGIQELRAAHRIAAQDTRITILLATALMEGNVPKELREAHKLLDEAVRLKPAVAPMARLYQGEIQVKLGDRPGAVRIWKTYLGQMPADDPRRGMFEEKIAQVSLPR